MIQPPFRFTFIARNVPLRYERGRLADLIVAILPDPSREARALRRRRIVRNLRRDGRISPRL